MTLQNFANTSWYLEWKLRMHNNPETEATELSCSFIQNLSMHPSFSAHPTTKSPPMQFPLAPWPPPKPIPRSPRCPLPPWTCKIWPPKQCAEIKIISLHLRSTTIWRTINLRISASNVPVSPVTFIFDPSLLRRTAPIIHFGFAGVGVGLLPMVLSQRK